MLPPNYPDYRDLYTALNTVREFVTKLTDEQLKRRLTEAQALGADGVWYYLPYLVAYRALKSTPRWLNSGEGATFRTLAEALQGLAEEHASQVAQLELIVPASLRLDMPAAPYSGSVGMSFRL